MMIESHAWDVFSFQFLEIINSIQALFNVSIEFRSCFLECFEYSAKM